MKTIDDKEVSDEAAQFYDRVKAGERIEVFYRNGDQAAVCEELMHAGLIETQALVWETRVCYVLTGTDPCRETIAGVIREHASDDQFVDYAFIDKILAVLK